MLKEFRVHLQKLAGAKTKNPPYFSETKMETLTSWVYFKGKDFTSIEIILS